MQTTHCIFITKTKTLREVNTDYCENHTRPIKTLCEQNANIIKKQVVH